MDDEVSVMSFNGFTLLLCFFDHDGCANNNITEQIQSYLCGKIARERQHIGRFIRATVRSIQREPFLFIHEAHGYFAGVRPLGGGGADPRDDVISARQELRINGELRMDINHAAHRRLFHVPNQRRENDTSAVVR